MRKAETSGEKHTPGEAGGPPPARERHLLTQYAVTRVLAEATTLAEAIPAILRAIAENLDWDVADFWQFDPVGGVLRCVDIWHQPEAAVGGFIVTSRQSTFAPPAGLPGRVWSTRTAHWIVDVVDDADFPRAAAAARAGLRSAFAFPIRLGAEVLGVLEFFSRQVRKPDAEGLEVFDALGSQIGQFIERKRVEDELYRSRDQLAVILRSVADGITVTQPNGGILYANDAAVRMLGYPSDEALRAAPVQEVFARFEMLDEAGQPFPVERLPSRLAYEGVENPSAVVRFRVKATGEERWSIVRSSTIRDEAGRVLSAVNIFHDVTEHRRVEEGQRFLAAASVILSSSLDYETTLASAVHLALPHLADWCYVDIREADGTIRRVAAAHTDPAKDLLIRELLRYPPDPQGNHTVVQVLRSGQSAIVSDVDDEHTMRNSRNAEHRRLVEALGGIRSFMTVPLTARGATLGAITFLSTTGTRRYGPLDLALAEDLARRAALAVDNARLYREAQEAVQARDEFLSVAAHELKTPITSLRGYAQLILRQLDRDAVLDAARVARALQVIDQQSDKLTNLVNQLLDASRIDAGRLVLNRQVVDVRGLVEEVAAAAQAGTQKHRLSVQAPVWVRALVDPVRLEQVVTNLVDNAIKYSPAGGTVDIAVEVPRPDALRIAVTDQGIGITPQHRGHIFDRFYQAHGAGQYGGMGLGLYISRQIIDLHGGHIAAEFPAEGGTRFVVVLPTGLDSLSAPKEDGRQPT